MPMFNSSGIMDTHITIDVNIWVWKSVAYTGCSEKKYTAQNRYSIQTTNDREMKQRPIDS